jgi:hypothetical protein
MQIVLYILITKCYSNNMNEAINLELRKCEDDTQLISGETVAIVSDNGTVKFHRVVNHQNAVKSGDHVFTSLVYLDDRSSPHPVNTLYRIYTTVVPSGFC